MWIFMEYKSRGAGVKLKKRTGSKNYSNPLNFASRKYSQSFYKNNFRERSEMGIPS